VGKGKHFEGLILPSFKIVLLSFQNVINLVALYLECYWSRVRLEN